MVFLNGAKPDDAMHKNEVCKDKMGDQKKFPLTQSQEGLWSAQYLEPENPIFNTGEYIEIIGALDVERFARAVNQVMQEADVLALQITVEASVARQWVNPKHIPQLEVVDLRLEPDPVKAAIIAMNEDMATPLDLANSPLAVQRLYQLGDEHYYWYQRIHHLLVDGWGQSLVNTHVAALYRGDAKREPLTPYSRWLEDDRAYLGSERELADLQFWQQNFEQSPVVADLSFGKGAVPITAYTAHRLEETVPQVFEDALIELCRRENQTWPDVVTALTAAYICRHTAADETVIGVPYMGRMGQVSARIPAMVMNVLPLRVRLDAEQQVPEFLMTVTKALQKVRRHGRYRSEQLRRSLGLLGGHKRLYGPTVNVLPFDCAQLELPGSQTVRHPLGNGPVEDITVTFRADAVGQNMRVELHANPNRYTEQDVQVHLKRLTEFLTRALTITVMKASGVERLGDIPLLTDEETYQWTHGCNSTNHDVPQTTLVKLMEATWQQTPDAPALMYDGEGPQTQALTGALSYRQLEQATAYLAKKLADAGVRRGDVVAVAIPRSFELVVALVAILRAGAAYLPLDTDFPAQRIATIVQSAQPKLALIAESVRSIMPADLLQWVVDVRAYLQEATGTADAVDGANISESPEPFDAAYVIYTSGSTGAPKGVVIEHDAIVNRLLWMQAHYDINAQDRILQKTPATFDVSVWEFFLPLISGATLVIAPPGAHKDPQHLAQIMRDAHITTLHFVPSMLSVFLAQYQLFDAYDGQRFTSLKRVFCSGEALPAELRDQFHATLGGGHNAEDGTEHGAELHNLYGPTEAAVDVTYWPAAFNDYSTPVPIGFPVWNTQLYILDKNLNPVPPGVAGYLYLAGRQLARGYLGRDDLTQERFVTNPFIAGQRMYATGDLARWNDDGAVVFLGRSDFQIKIRGQRVELEEIESTVARIPDVLQAAVIVREDQPGDARIVAYVVVNAHAGLNEEALRQNVAARLPEYMVPSAFVLLPELPVTSNGKLDRKALPVPVFKRQADQAGELPKTKTQKRLAALFASVLKRTEPVYVNDDFFILGGHSLLAAELMLDIRAQWGHAIGLGALFERPTVLQLASYLDQLDALQEHAGQEGFGIELVLRTHKATSTPKPALFCIHPAGGVSWCYGALARSITTDRDVIGIQSPGLDIDAALPATLQALAQMYTDLLVKRQPEGPYHLLGWSVGGIIAHAIAVELQKRNLPVGMLCLLDAYPSDCWRSEDEVPADDAAYKALMHIAGHDPEQLDGVELTRDSVIAFLRRSGHPLGYLADDKLQGVIQVVGYNNRLVKVHQHERYNGRIVYIRAALDHEGKDLHPEQWMPYAKEVQAHDVASLHAHLVSAQIIEKFSALLDQTMEGLDHSF